MTQNERVLAAFLSAPGHKLTTAQIDSIPFMTGQRQRISDLRKQGHEIRCTRIKGKNQSVFEYMGKWEDVKIPEKPLPEPLRQWRLLPNGWEVLA